MPPPSPGAGSGQHRLLLQLLGVEREEGSSSCQRRSSQQHGRSQSPPRKIAGVHEEGAGGRLILRPRSIQCLMGLQWCTCVRVCVRVSVFELSVLVVFAACLTREAHPDKFTGEGRGGKREEGEERRKEGRRGREGKGGEGKEGPQTSKLDSGAKTPFLSPASKFL